MCSCHVSLILIRYLHNAPLGHGTKLRREMEYLMQKKKNLVLGFIFLERH